jgi:hypothetical protein
MTEWMTDLDVKRTVVGGRDGPEAITVRRVSEWLPEVKAIRMTARVVPASIARAGSPPLGDRQHVAVDVEIVDREA